jgi:flagellar motor switch protein FliN
MSDEFSQDEIDALMNNGDSGDGEAKPAESPESAAPAEPQPEAAQADENIELTQEELDALLNNVGEAAAAAPAAAATAPAPAAVAPPPPAAPQPVAHPVRFPSLNDEGGASTPKNMEFLLDVALQVSVELGRSKMLVKDVLNVGMGSVIELDKLSGEPVDVMINGKLIAHGEVVVVDENFGVKIVDVIAPDQRLNSAG